MTAVDRYLRVHIRWSIRRDLSEMVAIEEASFASPWSEDDFLRCLRVRNCIGMVAEHEDRVVGFMLYSLEKGHIDLLDLAVAPWCRRRGVGTQMVQKLRSKLSGHHRTHLRVVSGEWNLGAHLFLKASGLTAETVLRGHYEETGEDGYEFHLRLPGVADEYRL